VRAGSFALRLAHAAATPRLAVLGPSGSGKSMTLRAVAGLLGPGAGRVVVGGEEVGDRPAETRHVGYVPQGAVLFPGRTVWQQVTAGVDADPRVASWWLVTLRIDGLAGRLPEQLSGGQRQRVALAAALAREPRLLLLDEPFSALDAPVRQELRRELRRLQREAGLSTVLVTHDPEEAAQLADELLVLDGGRLLQAGTRREVFDAPAGPEVARLLGYPPVNAATVASPTSLDVGDVALAARPAGLGPGRAVLWTVRPDRVALRPAGPYPGTVVVVADEGLRTTVTVRLAGSAAELTAPCTGPAPGVGEACRLDVAPEDVLVWPSAEEPAPRPARV
jgi:molybdate transport system permease protein